MQPLVSPVDHESRHNAGDARGGSDGGSERAPLLRHGYARTVPPAERRRRALAALAVAAMLLVLVGGVVIGIYLLVVQQRTEPEVVAVRVLGRGAWDPRAPLLLAAPATAPPRPPASARHLLAAHTASEECGDHDACRRLLRRLREERGELPYNVAVSSDGGAYEALGWYAESPLVPAPARPSLVVAFIGNFTDRAPGRAQVEAARRFCAEAVSRGRLSPSFTLLPHSPPSRLDGALSSLAPSAEPRT